jgi:hypothetical protein
MVCDVIGAVTEFMVKVLLGLKLTRARRHQCGGGVHG